MIEATPQHLLDCVALVYDDQLKRPDFVLELVSDKSNNILRTDVENNKVNIYFSEISNNAQQFSFGAEVVVEVENPQPGTAKVFDYYAP
ncbi:hypothetical protein AVEN_13787-1, partial [Araneus ventricosus]